MNQSHANAENSIAMTAELELWQSIREDTRRRLTRVVSIGVLYLLAALAVGAYLILTMAEVASDTVVLHSWRPELIDVTWMKMAALGYAVVAFIAIVGYLVILMMILQRLPALLCSIAGAMPWIGSTMRMVAMGEWCQSIYQSLLRSQTYGDALQQASQAVDHAGLRRWSAISSKRIELGHPLSVVLQSSPIQDQPLSAVAVLAAETLAPEQAVLIWHRAASECHVLAQSRLDRTAAVLSISFLLASVFVAFFALLLMGLSMQTQIRGLMY
ncbi:hypothetical protein Enr13x_43180 [Stieleria neptunia]|uniref:Bacterial type II secretion system protein F domain protein n=1 Tax=Stieleria neptunia TaxID=2527979 RepID=A0A518HUC1_9BACT|nr:hypothetical protein [Stieleria neptunia]QDV44452.1 hypothetical protein Enr13x_43180 [Stieleria neptunia]